MSDEGYRVITGDCIEVMRTMEAQSIDAIVTDPPYGIEFMGKEWDGWDSPHAFGEWCRQWGSEALRVLKPGGHLLAFGGTRMYHRLVAGLEDAGFEIRDTIAWLYGSGFPKSLDVSKAIDKAAGAERKVVGKGNGGLHHRATVTNLANWNTDHDADGHDITAPATDDARTWSGFGTALKPAHEPIVVARKPLTGTVAANVLAHGTGALNIDKCRVGTSGGTSWDPSRPRGASVNAYGNGLNGPGVLGIDAGRWPANVALDEEAAAMLDEQSGGASRFFYCAKASRADREAGLTGLPERRTGAMSATADGSMLTGSGNERTTARANDHPTVKPHELMRWLVRLVGGQPGSVILDPFTGSGSTGRAAMVEGFRFIGIEQDEHYGEIAKLRIADAAGMGL